MPYMSGINNNIEGGTQGSRPENCQVLYQYIISDTIHFCLCMWKGTRNSIRGRKFQSFQREHAPDPLVCVCYRTLEFPPSMKKSLCINPLMQHWDLLCYNNYYHKSGIFRCKIFTQSMAATKINHTKISMHY